MNGSNDKSLDPYRSYLLLEEISGEQTLSQRDISKRLGIAVGLVNLYLKNLVSKGYVRVKNFPKNRYAYLLTPQGLAEKSRLAYQHLSYFTSLYTTARQDYLTLFSRLRSDGVTGVVFCGVDEVAEIAYISLLETGISLVAVMDEDRAEEAFFGMKILPLEEAPEMTAPLVISSFKRSTAIREKLVMYGVPAKNILLAGNIAVRQPE